MEAERSSPTAFGLPIGYDPEEQMRTGGRVRARSNTFRLPVG